LTEAFSSFPPQLPFPEPADAEPRYSFENLFGVLRGFLGSNDNPTVDQFEAALKTAIITCLSGHNRGANCSKDDAKLLTDGKALLYSNVQQAVPDNQTTGTLPLPELSVDEEPAKDLPDPVGPMMDQGPMYVAGYLGSIMLKGVDCDHCRHCIEAVQPGPLHIFTQNKEWTEKGILCTLQTTSSGQ